MRSDVVPARSFDQDSPVCAYWLARSEKFEVRSGRRRGVVEGVKLGESGRAEALVVRFGAFRRTVPATAVDSVVPATELLVIRPARPPRRVTPALEHAAGRARHAGTALAHACARATSAGVASTRSGGLWLAPRAVRAGRASAGAVLALSAWTAVGLALIARFVHVRGRSAALAGARISGAVASSAATAIADVKRYRREVSGDEDAAPDPPAPRRAGAR